ncbi:HNH endonuclease [Bdellovibrio sp. qaytius]|nr:HNH endonuclease [Bdellovibrio sp. qaytius]
MLFIGGSMNSSLKKSLTSVVVAITLLSQIASAQIEQSPESTGLTEVQVGPAPTELPEKVIEMFSPRTDVYYIKIHKIADQIISIVSSLKMFSLDNLIAKKNEAMSLLNFEYHDNPAVTAEAYERVHHFGGWVKNKKSGDCFNTRNKVLVRDNKGTITLKEDNKCSVATGEWVDAYTGSTLTDAQAEIQIDHMVPLHEAYISGAYKWTFKERCLYGNYLGYKNHLVSVSGEANNEKSSKTPEEYMPSNPNYQCEYLKDWLKIKSFWGLSLVSEEMKAILQLVEDNHCDKSTLVVTRQELEEQEAFFKENVDLCKAFEQDQHQDKAK